MAVLQIEGLSTVFSFLDIELSRALSSLSPTLRPKTFVFFLSALQDLIPSWSIKHVTMDSLLPPLVLSGFQPFSRLRGSPYKLRFARQLRIYSYRHSPRCRVLATVCTVICRLSSPPLNLPLTLSLCQAPGSLHVALFRAFVTFSSSVWRHFPYQPSKHRSFSRVLAFASGPLHWCLVPLYSSRIPTPFAA